MNKKITYLLLVISVTINLPACKKEKVAACYDKEFHEQHKDDGCLQDCPGVTGCDGKHYCNECNMYKNGIPRTM